VAGTFPVLVTEFGMARPGSSSLEMTLGAGVVTWKRVSEMKSARKRSIENYFRSTDERGGSDEHLQLKHSRTQSCRTIFLPHSDAHANFPFGDRSTLSSCNR
jgi:hypothetical protein